MAYQLKFQKAATASAIRAARACGLDSFDVLPGPNGPIIRVRPASDSGTPQDILDELKELSFEA
ncbi:MAG: hypothetical protein KKE42_14840 [Alphaproteobacteria bacterium]|nr:hypothetical protein [Alphaproteobacteria bacterium]MBU3975066.1 hypothetical protein [Alphaproteobacteria bacterium]MBU4136884.1 hypothetical protein [Alphaproteobacteria bacterium]